MGRLGRIVERLERVLELGEFVLRELAGGELAPELFERHLALRWDAEYGRGRLVPIEKPALFALDDLVGIDRNVQMLLRNTEQFVRGLPANNVLLYGERGTGKSSAVKGLLERFGARGLRVVEVQKDQLVHLPRVLAALRRDAGAHRFMVFCDDLSFSREELGSRELKAALEGSIDAPPENVLIIATSNRRHLLPESMADNRGAHVDEQGELHLGEALDEKLALSDRFGLRLGFYPFDQKTYLEIVEHYLNQADLDVDAEEVREEALRWALERASRTGRAARQYVDDLIGREALRRER